MGCAVRARRDHLDPRSLTDTVPLCPVPVCDRYADLSASGMGEIARGNKLAYPPESAIEYAVHGKFKRARGNEDANGLHGAWWVPLRRLVKQIGTPVLQPLLEDFETKLAEARAAAVLAAADASDEDDE